MAVRLSTLRVAGHSLHPGNMTETHFCYRLSRPQAIVRVEGLSQFKNPVTPLEIETPALQLAS
jgi:hypothetical protein